MLFSLIVITFLADPVAILTCCDSLSASDLTPGAPSASQRVEGERQGTGALWSSATCCCLATPAARVRSEITE